VASSIGVIGFVIFAGGVVMWERFAKMGIPADEAVATVPKSVLVTTGAHFLVPALLIAGLIVLVVVAFRAIREDESRTTTNAERVAEDRSGVRKKVLWAVKRAAFLAVILFLGEAAYAISDFVHHPAAIVILTLIALAGATVIGIALHQKRSGAVLALVAFPAVGAFWVAHAFEHTSYYPTVVPMAYSRAEAGSTARVETGFLVAETNDRIWFASLPRAPSGTWNELREFPRSETDDLEIGALTDMSLGEQRDAVFANNLCVRLWYERRLAAGGCPPHPGLATKGTVSPRVRRS
jgi:hypothetical protein